MQQLPIAVIYADDFQKADASLIDLIQRKISWGQYVTKSKERLAALQREIIAEDRNLTAGLQQSHENELA
jgi:hypothetical protein